MKTPGSLLLLIWPPCYTQKNFKLYLLTWPHHRLEAGGVHNARYTLGPSGYVSRTTVTFSIPVNSS